MWTPVKNYEKYEVHPNGMIRNRKTKHILKPEVCEGYLRVRLYIRDKVSKHVLVHRVVASTFLDNPKGLPEVNHKDENKFNNTIGNLEWCTSQYNNQYSKNKPVTMFCTGGRQHSKTFTSITNAWLETGVDISSIIRCCKGKQKHAGGNVWKYASEVEMTETSWADKREVEL